MTKPKNKPAERDDDNEPDDPRRDCPWKCPIDGQYCRCLRKDFRDFVENGAPF